ncbi:ACP S-malonyltransferase [Paenibacillus sp. SI8]|uniref:ACP S-malonyltransferase n=1 Tax=unclassified Paenibacillus TaxID=185978 RepID=UPI003466B58E
MVAFIFPGQGSQRKGMGGTLFDEFKELTLQADQILGFSMKELCMEDPHLNLNLTQYTQPALYIVNALSYLKKIRETVRKPDFVAGHSLGEYNALFAAGAFDFETGLKLVKKRGELMSRAAGGGMAAVIGISEDQVRDIIRRNNLQNIDIANLNSPFQIVISGPKSDIDFSKPIFESIPEVIMFTQLKTSGAFHSRYMEEARKEFEVFLNSLTFSNIQIPVISNVLARPYKQSEIKQNLVDQITHTVKWTESIRYLMGLGEIEFEEIGTGNVLTGLIQRIRREAEPLVIEPEQVESQAVNELLSVSAQAHRGNGFDEDISPLSLGSSAFKKDYDLRYAYVTGGMYRGIASKEMVVKVGKAGMLGFFGSGGLKLSQIEEAIQYIQKELTQGQAYGMNLIMNLNSPEIEEKTVDLYLRYSIKHVEASAFISITPAIVKYRAKGLTRDQSGNVTSLNKIIAKVSRPEVAEMFLSPAPERIVYKLLADKKITAEEAELLKKIPVADDICVEADSGGHTDGGVAYAMIPAMMKIRDEMMQKYKYPRNINVGAAGGIGTPDAVAAAFILGADFILTGSINQCTAEASTSNAAKDLLQQINIQDTEYAPAGDMFELGSKVQVLKKGVFFPARANKLYDLYFHYNSIDEIDRKTKDHIQDKYFKRSFDQVYEDCKSFHPPQEIEKAERNPKYKMAMIFKWYFGHSTQWALSGNEEHRVDFQIQCGPALGAFNQWVKGTVMENWRNRHVDEIGEKLMTEAAKLLNNRMKALAGVY